MNNEQPLALRLASSLERSRAEHGLFRDSGTELRRQHAEIERLRSALSEVLAFQSAREGPSIHDFGRWRRIADGTPSP
jgi:hypothetical protein